MYSNITIKWPIYFVVCLLNVDIYPKLLQLVIPRAHQGLRGSLCCPGYAFIKWGLLAAFP